MMGVRGALDGKRVTHVAATMHGLQTLHIAVTPTGMSALPGLSTLTALRSLEIVANAPCASSLPWWAMPSLTHVHLPSILLREVALLPASVLEIGCIVPSHPHDHDLGPQAMHRVQAVNALLSSRSSSSSEAKDDEAAALPLAIELYTSAMASIAATEDEVALRASAREWLSLWETRTGVGALDIGMRLTPERAAVLGVFSKLRTLHIATLPHGSKPFAPLTALTHLCIRDCNDQNPWPSELAQQLRALETLALARMRMRLPTDVACLVTLTQLTSLSLTHCGMNDAGCAQLAATAPFRKRLRQLSLRHNSGILHPACLSALTSLVTLDLAFLSRMSLRNKATPTIAHLLPPLPLLRSLNLENTSIRDDHSNITRTTINAFFSSLRHLALSPVVSSPSPSSAPPAAPTTTTTTTTAAAVRRHRSVTG